MTTVSHQPPTPSCTGADRAKLLQAHFCANALPELTLQAERAEINEAETFFPVAQLAIDLFVRPASLPRLDWTVKAGGRLPSFLSNTDCNRLGDAEFLVALHDWLASAEHRQTLEGTDWPEGSQRRLEVIERTGWERSFVGDRLRRLCATLRSSSCPCNGTSHSCKLAIDLGATLGEIVADLTWEAEWGLGDRLPIIRIKLKQLVETYDALAPGFLGTAYQEFTQVTVHSLYGTVVRTLVAAIRKITQQIHLDEDLFELPDNSVNEVCNNEAAVSHAAMHIRSIVSAAEVETDEEPDDDDTGVQVETPQLTLPNLYDLVCPPPTQIGTKKIWQKNKNKLRNKWSTYLKRERVLPRIEGKGKRQAVYDFDPAVEVLWKELEKLPCGMRLTKGTLKQKYVKKHPNA